MFPLHSFMGGPKTSTSDYPDGEAETQLQKKGEGRKILSSLSTKISGVSMKMGASTPKRFNCACNDQAKASYE
jgi:hypothetical protein